MLADGALWGVSDKVAKAVADDYYTHLLLTTDSGSVQPALALHAAVRNVRAAHPAAPELWAPFVHVGA